MTAQTITPNLILVADFNQATNTNNMGSGQGASLESDFYYEGTSCYSRKCTGAGSFTGFSTLGPVNPPAGNHYYVWADNLTPGLVDTRANLGMCLTVGSGGTAYRKYAVSGSEDSFSGWNCYVADPSLTGDQTVGNPSNSQTVGFGLTTTANTNRSNLGIDVIRFGTGLTASGGGTPDPDLTFSDIATQNDNTSNRWGVFQGIGTSSYRMQGDTRIGIDDASSPTVFVASNQTLLNPNKNPSDVAQKTSTAFTGVSLRGSATSASFTSCTFNSLDTTDDGFIDCDTAVNPVLSATFDSCIFLKWGSFGATSTVSIDRSSFVQTGVLFLNGGSVSNTTFFECPSVQAGTSFENISNCSFTKAPLSNTSAIETSISAGTYSLVGCSFNGYNPFDDLTDSAIYFTASTGTITVNISGGAIPSYRSNGAIIVMQTSSTLTLTGLQPNTEVRVYETGTQTEVAGVENSGTTEIFAISSSSVDIVLHSLEYEYIRLVGVDTSNDLTLPIQQTEDRQYENP